MIQSANPQWHGIQSHLSLPGHVKSALAQSNEFKYEISLPPHPPAPKIEINLRGGESALYLIYKYSLCFTKLAF